MARRIRGDDWRLAVTLRRNGTPVDLTSATVISQLRTSGDLLAATFDVALDDDPSTGRLTLSLPAETTAEIPPGDYRFDIEVTSDGRRQTFWPTTGGPAVLEVLADVTRTDEGGGHD